MAISPIRYTVVAFTTGHPIVKTDADGKPVQDTESNGVTPKVDADGNPVWAMTDPPPAFDERAFHHVLVKLAEALPGVRIVQVGSGLGARNPLPPAPDTHHPHVAKLREAGHHAAADHLEHVGALHADMHSEHVQACDAMVKALPHDGFVPGRPVHEHIGSLTDEVTMHREHGARHRAMLKALRGASSMHRVKQILAGIPDAD